MPPLITEHLRNLHVIIEQIEDHVATIALNDPRKRNALSMAMFDALDGAVSRVRDDAGDIRAVLLRGEGKAFCAGFDLAAAVDDPSLMPSYIRRLSSLNRSIRRLPMPVVAAVRGAAIAGGCAMLSACDFVVAAPDAKLGYPVHRIGISPAVTLPTLMPMIGDGQARALVMSGELIDGREAHRIGLASHLAESPESVDAAARELAASIAAKPPVGVRTTKQWLNELDGSLDDARFDPPAEDSAARAGDQEASDLLRKAWSTR